MLNKPLPERVMKYEVTERVVRFNDKIMLPYEPFIGTLGVSPQIEAVLSLHELAGKSWQFTQKAVVAMEEPQMAPNPAHARMVDRASPPRRWPTNVYAA